MKSAIVLMLVLGLTVFASTCFADSQGEWQLRIHRGGTVETRFLTDIDSLTFGKAIPEGMVWIPPGNVRLGRAGIADPENDFYVPGFYIDRYEVTNAQYKKFIDAGGYTTQAYWNPFGWWWRVQNNITLPADWNSNDFHGGGIAGNEPFPVNGVSWFEADAYCRWAMRRLPTEAEWEKTAKGGCEMHGDPQQCDASDVPYYPWGNDWPSPYQANWMLSDHPYVGAGWTTPVGYYDGETHDGYPTVNTPSPYGLYDVTGNVWEWCSSKPFAYPYDPYDGREQPQNGPGEDVRVLRGGSYDCDVYGNYLKSCFRYSFDAYDRRPSYGFRTAKSGS